MTRLVKNRFTLKRDCGPAFVAGAMDVYKQMQQEKLNQFNEEKQNKLNEALADDQVEPKTGSAQRMSERQAWKNRSKDEGKRLEEERLAKEQADKLAAEKEEAERKGFSLDYTDDMSKKEIRKESRENKRGIRSKYKEGKKELKEQGLKGKEKRKAKKELKKEKKESKKENKCAKYAAKGKTSKKWYTKNC